MFALMYVAAGLSPPSLLTIHLRGIPFASPAAHGLASLALLTASCVFTNAITFLSPAPRTSAAPNVNADSFVGSVAVSTTRIHGNNAEGSLACLSSVYPQQIITSDG
jgi:hypothetical protein